MAYIYETADCANYDILRAFADLHKKEPTEAERILWDYLKSQQLGYKFRRQHIINDFIVDFVNLKAKVVIEVDGQYHLKEDQIVKDKDRTEELQKAGFAVMRFTNDEVIGKTTTVLNQIKESLMEIIPPAKNRSMSAAPPPFGGGWEEAAWAVDAGCSGNPGPMEYQGVDLQTGAKIFHFGPVKGTNNIGEFLAIVHALALMEKQGIEDKVIYSDSVNAQIWVQKQQCKTKLERTPETEKTLELVRRAELWLRIHSFRVPILKWETKKWGEIPADFGRK
ncbi:MAG: DUF559 domain-containing protein [Prevotella sp.]|nr:DUF559 domain-containing protein [Prevotella sp.]MBO5613677.1 DUF559 domain-containing protein [Prevotella sp.]